MDYLNNLSQKVDNKLDKGLIIDKVFFKLKTQIIQENQLNLLENKLDILMYNSDEFNIDRCNKILLNIVNIKQKLN